jgi:hypothetical protein
MNNWQWYGCPNECLHIEMKQKGLHIVVRCTHCKRSIFADTSAQRYIFYQEHKTCT